MSAADVDACMRLGAGHPMGPLELLDFVGLDVAAAIGESLDRDRADAAPVPACSARWSPRASSGASPGPDFTSTR